MSNLTASGHNPKTESVEITRKGTVSPIKGAAETFTGDVSIEFSIPKRGESHMTGGLVTFQPGARCNWHTHPKGQLLIIMEGAGRVQEWGDPVRSVVPGDLVWFPAGIKHWHGAMPDRAMRHYAIQEEQDGSPATWLESVTDAQYNENN